MHERSLDHGHAVDDLEGQVGGVAEKGRDPAGVPGARAVHLQHLLVDLGPRRLDKPLQRRVHARARPAPPAHLPHKDRQVCFFKGLV